MKSLFPVIALLAAAPVAAESTWVPIVAVLGRAQPDTEPDESTVIEVTPDGEVVWQLTLKNAPADSSPGFFSKAERTGTMRD